ncbi:MAG: metal ABC transporter permease [Bacteroidota bacterium]
MKETLLFLATPITASIIMAGMLGYFGTHILTRRIIFIDIAVAQIAALGTMIGILLGFAEEALEVQMISYFFTLIVIGAFAFLKSNTLPIPAEAVIGIIYCLGLALALLLAERIPGGSNFITKTITGNILWVTWDKVIKLGLLFAIIGLIHILLGKKFYTLSNQMNEAEANQELKDRLLNLLFYITFGVVVVKAVLIGGIFLVFTLLIAPAVAAGMFVKSWKGRMLWSWIIGLTATIIGIIFSYWLNLSNGPVIVCILGLLVFAMAFAKLLKPQKNGN